MATSRSKDDGFLAKFSAPLLPKGIQLERRVADTDELLAHCMDIAAAGIREEVESLQTTLSGGTEIIGEAGLFRAPVGQPLVRLYVDQEMANILSLAFREFLAQLRGEARAPYEQVLMAGDKKLDPNDLAAGLDGLQDAIDSVASRFEDFEAPE
ncbi:MAG: hypothetical protein U0974_02120 [Gemmatimonadales bacterium]|nr:hypothetical protein [Gemmatimonadales bacterium]